MSQLSIDLTSKETVQQGISLKVYEIFSSISLWYKDIIYYFQNLQCPPEFDKGKYKSLRTKSVKYSIID